MTEPVTLSVRTWTTKEPDEGDRHRYDVTVQWTETVVLRDATPEEKKAMNKVLAPKYRWQGEGSEPPKWTAADGTIVYRSYADYCND